MAIVRWRSLGFMVYTQQQISSFSTGVSVKMSQQPWFQHLWAPCRPPSQAHTHDSHIIPSRTHRVDRAPRLQWPSNQTSIWWPEHITPTISHQVSSNITELGPIPKFPTETWSTYPSWGPFRFPNHPSFHFPELRSDWKFLRKPPSHAPSSFPF